MRLRERVRATGERSWSPGEARSPLTLPGIALGVVLALAFGFVLMYQIAYANRIFPGVRALGYDLGGYSRDEAGALLQRSLDEFARRQLTVRYAEFAWTLSAQELGLRSDLAPILDSVFAVGREGNVFGRFSTQFGLWRQGRVFEHPSAAFDQDAQTALLQRLGREIDRPIVEARLAIRPDYSIELQEAQSSRKLDVDESRRRIQEALAVQSITQVELAVAETTPKSATNNLQQARDQAARLVSGPVTMHFRERKWMLDQAQLASIVRFNNDPGAPRAAYLERAALETWAKSLAGAINQAPQDARFAWAGGKLDVLRPSRDGLELDPSRVVDLIVGEAEGGHQDIELPVNVTKPAVPMEERESLGIKELIENARTSFLGSSPAKADNITLAAQRLNGAVVPPGATFSFNKEIGSTSLDAGFKMGWGITGGTGGNVKTVPSVAGGICQVATTLFHTVFWSGFPLEERNWHLYWIPSYASRGAVGLDATVDEESGLDFQFVNPTDTPILIQSWIDDNQNVNFALYGSRPSWTVKVDAGEVTDLVQADRGTVFQEDEPTMPEGNRLQVERANDGFVVTNVRHVILPSGEERTLRLVSRYKPSRNVILIGTGGKPARPHPTETVPNAATSGQQSGALSNATATTGGSAGSNGAGGSSGGAPAGASSGGQNPGPAVVSPRQSLPTPVPPPPAPAPTVAPQVRTAAAPTPNKPVVPPAVPPVQPAPTAKPR